MANSLPPRRPFIERTSTAILFIIAVFVVGLLVGAIIAKLRPPKMVNLPPTTLSVPKPTGDQTPFSSGERIKIVTTDPKDASNFNTRILSIEQDGTIKIPILGTLDVRGHTPFEIEQAIAQGYREQHMLNNALIHITREHPTTAPTK
jgi:protein involved in polysaccharide export with SLBB domain